MSAETRLKALQGDWRVKSGKRQSEKEKTLLAINHEMQGMPQLKADISRLSVSDLYYFKEWIEIVQGHIANLKQKAHGP